MKWIILIGGKEFNIETIRKIKYEDNICITQDEANNIVVECGKEYVRFEYCNEIVSDYEESQIDEIPFDVPHFVMMTYSSLYMLKIVLNSDFFPQDIYIDDDDIIFKLQTVSKYKEYINAIT